MMRKLTRQHVNAELAGLNTLLASLPEDDVIGRMSLASRRDSLVRELEALEQVSENRAKIALYFGGEPVIGSTGVRAGFGADSLGNFQDLLTKVWAAGNASLRAMGPIPDKDASQLHITSLVHGSFGFLLEELDDHGEPLFESALRVAADRAADYIASFADENEAKFSDTLEQLDPRVFGAVREFFASLYKAKATVRIVEGETDARFDHVAIERAWVRIEASNLEEEQITREGRLLGMIPLGRRFEFEPDGAVKVIEGKVGEKFSQSYLERMNNEQFAGRRWKALLSRKIVERKGRKPSETYTLLELDEIEKRPGEK
jgi:hypothetical protein